MLFDRKAKTNVVFTMPGLTSIERKPLSYNLILLVYGKMLIIQLSYKIKNFFEESL